ncbi:MAG: His/Gly/Thr/Pro-type tRNA ligase C-terminal domain-containing protein, partial [Thermoplasmata archaeon]|nr:His/Gly/Thr/Pro-type tRNA ligase C-terminal domain-containing protein [Thermoplasmata archaeon]
PGTGGGPHPHATPRAPAARLGARGVRARVDDSEDRPGAKYFRWEVLGAPLRLEIGGREAAAGTASAVSRLGARTTLGPENLESAIVGALADADGAVAARAEAAFVSAFAVVRELAGLKGIPKIAQIAWCGQEACGHRVEEAIDGALLGTPEGDPPILGEKLGNCLVCGTLLGVRWALAARPL